MHFQFYRSITVWAKVLATYYIKKNPEGTAKDNHLLCPARKQNVAANFIWSPYFMSCTQCKISQVLHLRIQIISLKQTPSAVSLNFLHTQGENFIVNKEKKLKSRYPFKARSDSQFASSPALN